MSTPTLSIDGDLWTKYRYYFFKHRVLDIELVMLSVNSNPDVITLSREMKGDDDPLTGFRWQGSRQDLARFWTLTGRVMR